MGDVMEKCKDCDMPMDIYCCGCFTVEPELKPEFPDPEWLPEGY
jgi:hypothetical protein